VGRGQTEPPKLGDNARILVVRLSAIGDVVRTIPAVKAVRAALPKAFIGWAVEDKAASILDHSPYIDTVHILPRRRWRRNYLRLGPFRQFIRGIRAAGYDTLLDFHGNAKSGLVGWLSRVGDRRGFARGYCAEFNHLATTCHIVPPGIRINRYERNFSLVESIIGPPPYDLDVDIPVDESVASEIDSVLERWRDPSRPFVVVHPVTSRPFKVWPPESYARVCNELTEGPERCQVLLTWGPDEREATQRVAQLAAGATRLAPPMTTLEHFACMVSRADLYFGGDTGPMHIASSMGTPVVAIFGPTDPVVNGPYRDRSRVLYAGLDCSPCTERKCRRAHECMTRITPDQALGAIRELLAARPQ